MKTNPLLFCRALAALVVALAAPLHTTAGVSLIVTLGLTSTAEASNSKKLLNRARAGDVNAMRHLAQGLWEGTIGRGRDCKNAVVWWKKAAEAGDPRSMVILGQLYEHGTYVSQNKEQARQYYEDAVDAGYEKAEKHLARVGGRSSHVARNKKSSAPEETEEEHSMRDRINSYSPDEKLFYGIKNNDIKWVKKAIEEGADVNKPKLKKRYIRFIREINKFHSEYEIGYAYKYPIAKAIEVYLSHDYDDTILKFLIQSGARLDVRQLGRQACLIGYAEKRHRHSLQTLWKQYDCSPDQEEMDAMENRRQIFGYIYQILPSGLLLYRPEENDIVLVDFGCEAALICALQEALVTPAEFDTAIVNYSSQGRHQYTTTSGALKTIKSYEVVPDTFGVIYQNWKGRYKIAQVLDDGLLVISTDGADRVQLVTGHPKQEEAVDGEVIRVTGTRTGVYEYTTVKGEHKIIPLIQHGEETRP